MSPDPEEPIKLAVNTARMLGVTCHSFWLLLCCLAFVIRQPSTTSDLVITAAFIAVTLVIPGFLYLILADYIQRRRRWAVVTVLVLACLHAVACALVIIISVIDSHLRPGVILAVLILLESLFLIAHCISSFPALYDPARHQMRGPRGFEPLLTKVEDHQTEIPPKSVDEADN